MNEGVPKSRLVARMNEVLPHFEILRHEDQMRHGIPDISVTGLGWTTWWEVKYANPGFESEKIQDVTMWKLARAGYARYIIFYEPHPNDRKVCIAHPNEVLDIKTGKKILTWQRRVVAEKFDYTVIAQFVARIHLKGPTHVSRPDHHDVF